ncbi:hypothetical protein D910_06043 [Dendroctonus ponderosae]|uniref:PiggyBac transposable element-derived protein domain-containing protein n=1 Tax=Dendroctonus ponderosae TaxID=77166 RepID=U4U432_DENPD|nr:hypothetical protein D910_06043 [Dendroctonus ponderosae]
MPPTNSCNLLTDEDSGDEDDVNINILPSSQLRAQAELFVPQNLEKDDDWEIEDEIPLSEIHCQSTIVSKSMSRNRLEHILSNIHCCDNNNLNKSDKFSNIRPLFDKLNSRFLHIAPMEPFHCVDEAMVPYFGIHGCKQFIRGKPLRYGYKLWVGATASGYIVWYEPYQGAKSAIKHCYKNLALGPSVVLESIGILQTKCKLSYSIYCDYFFNTLPLINTLTEKGVKCTGTIRENCLGNCHLVSDADLKKHRGSYDFRVTDDNSIVTEKWSDNNMVHMASNDYGIFPLHQVSRYSHKGRRRIQQQTIKNYNIYMERVDRSDQNISLYRIRVTINFCLFNQPFGVLTTLEMVSRLQPSAVESTEPCKRVHSNIYSKFASVMFLICSLVGHDDES